MKSVAVASFVAGFISFRRGASSDGLVGRVNQFVHWLALACLFGVWLFVPVVPEIGRSPDTMRTWLGAILTFVWWLGMGMIVVEGATSLVCEASRSQRPLGEKPDSLTLRGPAGHRSPSNV